MKEYKRFSKEHRKIEIFNAARQVFSDKGFNSTTVKDITTEAQVSPGTLYLYFNSKEDLYTLLSIELLKYFVKRIHEIINNNVSVETKIKKLSDLFIEVYEYDSNALITLCRLQSGETLRNLSGEVLQQLKKNASGAYRALSNLIKEGIENGLFTIESPEAIADMLWATYAGIILWVDSNKVLDNSKTHIRTTLNTAFKIFSKGLCIM
ncbi:MAG: TetR/AcrR family transcriptional regulator [Desulfobacula sp.]|nr:TetR/AcrR family transcriptional regulator [Desulfobacula sp.]